MTDQLCAVLLNPPTGSGNRTRSAVQRAATLLGAREVVICNLVGTATKSSRDLSTVVTREDWLATRDQLRVGLTSSHGLLFAWGLLAHLNGARSAAEEQVRWLLKEAIDSGHETAWAVGQCRHPSRWHQYTADRHGRAPRGSSEDRLRHVLTRRPLAPVEQWLAFDAQPGCSPW